MARPRKPTKLHVVQGTLRATRHRDRAGEPEVLAPLGDPPSNWPGGAKALWHELSGQVPEGVAGKADRIVFEVLCRAVGRLREHSACSPALLAQVRYLCGEFGMTPASRSKVSAPASREINPFAKLDCQ